MIAVAESTLSTSELSVLIAILLSVVGTLGIAYRTFQESRAANRAVNNSTDPNEPSIRENVTYLVQQQRQFESKGWNALPEDLGSAPALTETVRDLQHAAELNAEQHAMLFNELKMIDGKIDSLDSRLRDHDVWERAREHQKGSSHGD